MLTMISLPIAKELRRLPGHMSVLELGELQVETPPSGEVMNNGRLRDYCHANKSADWVTVDIGSRSADVVKLNLTEHIPVFVDRFDIIVDGGTMEHVGLTDREHYYAWSCLHRYLRVGGMIVGIQQRPGTAPGHCVYRYPDEFFDMWRGVGYFVSVLPAMWNGRPNPSLVHYVLRKVTDEEFVHPSVFWKNVDIDRETPLVGVAGNYPTGTPENTQTNEDGNP